MAIKSIIYESVVTDPLKIEKHVAYFSGLVLGLVSIVVDMFGVTITCLMAIMLLEFISECLVRVNEGKFSPKELIREIIIKFYYLLLLCGTSLLNTVVPLVENAVVGLAITMIILEFTSMVNNGHKLNINLGYLNTLIDYLKQKGNDNNESK